MVSSDNVMSDASSLTSILSNFNQNFSAVSSSWAGFSHDQIEAKVAEFSNDWGNGISKEMTAYANAVQLLEQYHTVKNNYKTAVDNYNAAAAIGDSSNVSSFNRDIELIKSDMQKIANEINALLKEACSVKYEATPLKPSTPKGEFTNYYQYNYNDPYCGGTIADSGCGPTSMAMVLSYLTGEEITPQQMAKEGDGKYTCKDGTVWTYFGDMAKKYGVQCDQMDITSKNIIDNLNNGKTLILSMGPGHFTSQGHFIVVRGIDDSGKIIVSDPNSEDRSNKTWDVNTLVSEGKQIWSLSA